MGVVVALHDRWWLRLIARWPSVAQSRRLLQEHMKTQNLLEELERANPGITQIETDEDGAIVMEVDEGEGEDVQSLLNDLEREMAKIARR